MFRCKLSNFNQFVRQTRWKSTMVSLSDMDALHEIQTSPEFSIPFSRAKIGPFFQRMPQLGNQFNEDTTLKGFLKRHMPQNVYGSISPDLERFGHRVSTDLLKLSVECERNPPTLVHYDGWGKRVDTIVTSTAWNQMKAISAEEGLIAIAYEEKFGQYSRLYQMAKNYLYTPSSGLYSCPLAMTDGAAKSLKMLGDQGLMEGAFSRLTSRDPARFWTSGQWMTERRGGSDVARGTETLAVPQPDGSYKLYGYKWFSSATDSDMTLTLARIVDQDGNHAEGTKGLSMFYLETRTPSGELNNIEVQRLKDKLGTRQLPTAELLLDGSQAYRVSPEGRGVASISTMLTLTRLHNSVSATAGMRRITNLARDYATKRDCFGKTIKDHPLHIKTLASMEVEARGALLFTLETARLLGLEDADMISDHQKQVFRLMTPVLKLYTAKQAVAVASEGLECFGGAGYLEDTDLPKHLRDAQVLPIWEGTTNILSLDVLRAISKTHGECLTAYYNDVLERVAAADNHPELQEAAAAVKQAAEDIIGYASLNTHMMELSAREFAYSLGRTYIGMLLVEHACWTGATSQDVFTANRWCEKDLTPVMTHQKHGNYGDEASSAEYSLVYDGYIPSGTPSKL